MLGLIMMAMIDAVIIGVIIMVIEDETEFPAWTKTGACGIVTEIVTGLAVAAIPIPGILGVNVAVGIGALAGGALISMFFGISFQRSFFAALAFLVIRILMSVGIYFLLT